MRMLNNLINLAIVVAVGIFVLTMVLESLPFILALLLTVLAQIAVALLLVGLDHAAGIS